MKRNIDDFDGMKDFIISIITVVAWVLIGVIIAIGYFNMETKGESVIISFVSMIFTIVSSLGILATIGVYFWQKNDINDKKKCRDSLIKKELTRICDYYKKIIDDIKRLSTAIDEHEASKEEGEEEGKIEIVIRGKYINVFVFYKNNNNNNETLLDPLIINQNKKNILDHIAYNTEFLDEKIYEILLKIYELEDTIDSYIDQSIINNIYSKKIDKAKIDELKGYSKSHKSNGFNKHQSTIDEIRTDISNI